MNTIKEVLVSHQVTVEIIAIGNELLNGGVQDTNTYWFSKQITELGGLVRRGTILPDEEDVIAKEIERSIEGGTNVILVAGGLGPTADDLTLSAVAKGAKVTLRLHEEAKEMIKASYDAFAAKGVFSQGGLNPGREKMAWFPEGAVPLVNPVGTAPGVLFQHQKSTIICFPGVPGELKGIFETSLQPFLSKTFTKRIYSERSLQVDCNDESLLDPYFKLFTADFPEVYLKARSGIIQENPQLILILSASSSDKKEVDSLLSNAAEKLIIALSEGNFNPRKV
jgi:nicotinamide-nucleotide amidase